MAKMSPEKAELYLRRLRDEVVQSLAFHQVTVRVYDRGELWRFFADGAMLAKYSFSRRTLYLSAGDDAGVEEIRNAQMPFVVRRVLAAVKARRTR